jgi:hypothetical protein
MVTGQPLSLNAAMPSWARSIAVYTSVDTTALTATGLETGITYIADGHSQHWNWSPIAAGVDFHVVVAITPKAPGKFWVVASPDAALISSGASVFSSGGNLVVSQSFDAYTVPPWLAPNKAPLLTSGIATGTLGLVTGVPGQTVYLFGGEISIEIVAAGQSVLLQDSSGVGIAEARTDTVGTFSFNRNGAPIPAGRGLRVVVGGGTASVGLAYSQA